MAMCHGLPNLGQTCYLNSTLQALASCPPFLEQLARARPDPTDAPCTAALRECITALRPLTAAAVISTDNGGDGSGAGGATHAHRAVRSLWKELQRGGVISQRDAGAQQDAEEILGRLCEVMLAEAEPPRHSTAPGLLALLQPPRGPAGAESAAVAGAGSGPCARGAAAAAAVLRGMDASGYTCVECNWRSDVQVHACWKVNLPLPMGGRGGALRLAALLRHSCDAEMVDGVQCPRCSARKALAATRSSYRSQPTPRSVTATANDAVDANSQRRRIRRTSPRLRSRQQAAAADADAVQEEEGVVATVQFGEAGQFRLARWLRSLGAGDPLTPMPWPSQLGGSGDESSPAGSQPAPRPPKALVEVRKWLAVCRTPSCLCLHVSRLVFSEMGTLVKDRRAISFPARLDLGPYCALEEVGAAPAAGASKAAAPPAQLYRLVAVVMHHGGADGGHYTCVARAAAATNSGDEDTWCHFDDETVRPVSKETVFGAEIASRVYMLFYSRDSREVA
jgi:hypothetical protein